MEYTNEKQEKLYKTCTPILFFVFLQSARVFRWKYTAYHRISNRCQVITSLFEKSL